MRGFAEECSGGQRWLRLLPPAGETVADIRFFLRGPLLDGTEGRAVLSRRRLIPVLGECRSLIAPKQVHGTTVLDSTKENTLGENVIENDAAPSIVEADGVLLDAFGLEASLRFADCAPVVVAPLEPPFSESRKKTATSWVLLMHSGFRGTVRNIARVGLEKVRERFGTDAVNSACAWIGPCIGGKNYPRDREEWTERGLATFRGENVRIDGGKFFFDIAGELSHRLAEAGISGERIFVSGIDTFDCRDRCYSWRGGDAEDRMFLWARLRDR